MADEISNSFVDIGKLSKPADTLVKKISNAVGGVFEPFQTVRMAKADATAALIRAESDIEIEGLRRRAIHRFIDEEETRQKNIESITGRALPLLNEGSDAGTVEDDWIAHFFEKGRIVSDEQMQELWASVLAGQVNSSGSFSKRTVNLLADLGKEEAEMFDTLCGFAWKLDDLVPLIFDYRDDIYKDAGVTFDSLVLLSHAGLIQFESAGIYFDVELGSTFTCSYFNEALTLVAPKDGTLRVDVGHTLFTRAGRELASICISKPVEGFVDYIKDKWKKFIP